MDTLKSDYTCEFGATTKTMTMFIGIYREISVDDDLFGRVIRGQH